MHSYKYRVVPYRTNQKTAHVNIRYYTGQIPVCTVKYRYFYQLPPGICEFE